MKYSIPRTGLLFVLLMTVLHVVARQDDIKLTPFTGTDFVRLVVNETFRQAPNNTFKIIIRSLRDGGVLWQGNVDLTRVDDKGKNTLSCRIGGLTPQLWSPSSPYLYEIVLEQYK